MGIFGAKNERTKRKPTFYSTRRVETFSQTLRWVVCVVLSSTEY